MLDFSRNAQFYGAVAGVSGAAAPVSGPIIDSDDNGGMDSFYFAGYVEATATASQMKVFAGSATDSLASTPIEVEFSQPSAFINCFRPTPAATNTTAGYRFVQCRLNTTGGAANSVLMSWGYNSRTQPTTNSTAVVGKTFIGTASAS